MLMLFQQIPSSCTHTQTHTCIHMRHSLWGLPDSFSLLVTFIYAKIERSKWNIPLLHSITFSIWGRYRNSVRIYCSDIIHKFKHQYTFIPYWFDTCREYYKLISHFISESDLNTPKMATYFHLLVKCRTLCQGRERPSPSNVIINW